MDDKLSAVTKSIVINSPSVDVQGNRIIVRGVLDNNFLSNISTPDYQRELIKNKVFWGLVTAFTQQTEAKPDDDKPTIPDVTLACRGSKSYNIDSTGAIVLPGERVFLVDGLQRVSALLHARELSFEGSTEPFTASLGCKVYLNTTIEVEREMFKNLNTNHTSVAADVLLREFRHTSPAAQAVFDWCNMEGAAILSRHICWQQNMTKAHLLRANSVFRTMNTLFARFHGTGNVTKTADIIRVADAQVEALGGYDMYLRNLNYFYEVLDKAFRLTNVAERVPYSLQLLPHLAFADVLAKHDDFWDGLNLKVGPGTVSKISTFAFSKEEIRMLMSTTKSSAVTMMRVLMTDHLNKGKQYKLKLTPAVTRPSSR